MALRKVGLRQANSASPHVSEPESVASAVAQLPTDFDVSLLASSKLGGLNSSGLTMSLERITIESGDEVALHATGNELIYVEDGRVSIELPDERVQLDARNSVALSTGDRFAISAAGQDRATILRLRLEPPRGETGSQASPAAEPVQTLLISGKTGRLISRQGTLYLARVVIPAGSGTGQQAFSGPIGAMVESGSIVVHDQSLPDAEIDAGHMVFLPGYTAFNATNEGSADAELLIAGLLAPPAGAAVGPTSTPTAAIVKTPTGTPTRQSRSTPTSTPTPAVDELATANAELTRQAGNVAQLATREADLSRTSVALQTEVASAHAGASDIAGTLTAVSGQAGAGASAAASTQVAVQTQISELDATRGALESELLQAQTREADLAMTVTAVNDDLEANEATTSAIASTATAAASAAASERESLEATIVALVTANAVSASDLQSASSSQADADATIETQTTEIANANATIGAQGTAISDANATIAIQSTTIDSQALELESADATASAQAAAIATSEANAAGLETELGNANQTITAQSAAAETASAEDAAALAAASATAGAYAATLDDEYASATAVSAANAQTASAQAGEIGLLNGTVVAQQTAAAIAQATAVQRAVDATEDQATIIALNTAVASNVTIAGSSLNPEYVQLSIQVDLEGILAGDPDAIEAANEAMKPVFAPFASCNAGVVLTFGHGFTIGQGTQLAAAINSIVQENYPTTFSTSAFDAYGDLSPQLGQVDFRIYFFTGCEAAEP